VRRVAAIVRLLIGLAMGVVMALLFLDAGRHPASAVFGAGAGVLAIWGIYTGMRDLF
jgi:hypothetical protein